MFARYFSPRSFHLWRRKLANVHRSKTVEKINLKSVESWKRMDINSSIAFFLFQCRSRDWTFGNCFRKYRFLTSHYSVTVWFSYSNCSKVAFNFHSFQYHLKFQCILLQKKFPYIWFVKNRLCLTFKNMLSVKYLSQLNS